ncbi:hypothetical protein [Pedobacter sp. SYSU D00535]|uniref:hypothetical protein n=1 Tax=Pedobacter sp. SYSU D00535 TaxID=2810308 RepID=UPI001A960C42|nr:hypothetical protein [Pedobacter sp. SYSU D00535]
MSLRPYILLNIAIFLFSLLISYGSNATWFNSQTIGEVSYKYETLFTPADFTFSIWAVIYTSLAAFMIYHTWRAFKGEENSEANRDFRKIGWWFLINNFASAAWVLAWTRELLLASAVLMIIQLICLIFINIELGIYDLARNLSAKVFTQFPFAIYLAWISIATIANLSSVIGALPTENFILSAGTWTILLICFAAILSLFMVHVRKNVFFGIVVIWAIYGVASNLSKSPSATTNHIIDTVLACMVITCVSVIVQLMRNFRKQREAQLARL